MVFMTAERIGQTVIGNIYQKIQISAADGFLNDTFCFTGTETRNLCLQNIGISLITGECKTVLMLAFTLGSPFYEIIVDLFAERLATFQRDDAERTYRNGFKISFFFTLCSHE